MTAEQSFFDGLLDRIDKAWITEQDYAMLAFLVSFFIALRKKGQYKLLAIFSTHVGIPVAQDLILCELNQKGKEIFTLIRLINY